MKMLRALVLLIILLIGMSVFSMNYLDEDIPVQGKEQATDPVEWFPRYHIETVYNPAQRTMGGKISLVYRNTGDGQMSNLQFNLIGNLLSHETNTIRITQVVINGQLSAFSHQPYQLVIPLAKPLMPGKEIKVVLQFQTRIPNTSGRFGSQGGVFSLTAWYPVLAPMISGKWVSLPHDDFTYGDPYFTQSAYYEGTIELPGTMQVLAGTELKSTSRGRWKTWSFQSNLPLREFAIVFSENFHFLRQTVDGIKIIYAYTGSPRNDVITAAARSLKLFSSLWGPYPFKQFYLAETPLSGLYGMEYPGLVLLREGGGNAEYTVAHEVGHQWWYGQVGNDQVKEPWIDESLANYSALLYLRKYRPEEYQERFVSYEDRVFGQRLKMNRELGQYRNAEEYREAVYVKGALFWEHMGNLTGEEKLAEVLRQMQVKYRYHEITTNILLNALEEKTDIDPAIIQRLLNN